MKKRNSGQAGFCALVYAGFMLISTGLQSACATAAWEASGTAEEAVKAFPLIVPSPQEAVYNGQPQQFYFSYDGEEVPELAFYHSPEARAMYKDGSSAAPVNAGTYYVLVRLAYEEVFAEFRILKCPVKIEAAEIQEARYNGDPKRVQVSAEPDVPLSYFYYPNPEFREEAVRTARENLSRGNTAQRPRTEFRGYRRVDRAPIEQGTYYVWVYFPGDENHEAASANIEFTILPPGGGR